MKKLIAVLFLAAGLSLVVGPSAEARHSTAKVVGKAVSYPFRHPVKTAVSLPRGGYEGLKGIAYGVLFVAEPVADLGNLAFTGLDDLVSVEIGKKFDPVHYVAVGFQYADNGIEKAQDFLFGSHN